MLRLDRKMHSSPSIPVRASGKGAGGGPTSRGTAPPRVAVMLSTVHAAHRANLEALRLCARETGWDLEVFEAGNSLQPVLEGASALDGYDGVIAEDMGAFPGICWEEVRPPLVMLDPEPPLRGRFPEVRLDPGEVGRLAAKTLLAERCRSYAFVSARLPAEWADERGETFRQAVEAAGATFSGAFSSDPDVARDDDRVRLVRWLGSLPRPCGIFAAMDFRAREVADACRAAGLSVPLDIVLVGVDDDETLCEGKEPSLSSIRPDFRRCGEVAVETLSRLMNAPRRTARSHVVSWYGAHSLTIRASTRRLRPGCDARVAAALEKIRREATEGIGADDVARAMGVSRRRAEMLFRPMGCTIASAISDAKIERARHLLETTTMPIGRIAGECGFASAVYLAGLFKRRFGKPMRDWRATCRESPRR